MLSGTAFVPRYQTRIDEASRRQHTQIEILLVPAVHPNETPETAAALAPGGPDAKATNFLSIDTEGTELDILRPVDRKTFRPKLLCVENDFQEQHQADFLHSVCCRRTGKTLGFSNDFYEDAG